MISIVFAVECVQFITRNGAFDIDDLILNVFGAVVVFGFIKLEGIRKMVDVILK